MKRVFDTLEDAIDAAKKEHAIGAALSAFYDKTVKEPVPDEFKELLAKLK